MTLGKSATLFYILLVLVIYAANPYAWRRSSTRHSLGFCIITVSSNRLLSTLCLCSRPPRPANCGNEYSLSHTMPSTNKPFKVWVQCWTHTTVSLHGKECILPLRRLQWTKYKIMNPIFLILKSSNLLKNRSNSLIFGLLQSHNREYRINASTYEVIPLTRACVKRAPAKERGHLDFIRACRAIQTQSVAETDCNYCAVSKWHP